MADVYCNRVILLYKPVLSTIRAVEVYYGTCIFDGVCISTPPSGAVFEARLRDNQEGAKYQTVRLRKALGEMLPQRRPFLAPILFQLLWRCTTMENRPRGCDTHIHMHRRMPYSLEEPRLPTMRKGAVDMTFH